jgi:hypothetical protein
MPEPVTVEVLAASGIAIAVKCLRGAAEHAVDNRPWQGPGHPVAAYAYSEDRKAEHPASHLKGFPRTASG